MDSQKYNIKGEKKVTKIIKKKKYIYEFCFKKSGLFFKLIVGYKNEKGVIEDLKIKKKNNHENSKNISRTFSGVVMDSVGSVHFQIVP